MSFGRRVRWRLGGWALAGLESVSRALKRVEEARGRDVTFFAIEAAIAVKMIALRCRDTRG